MCVVRPVLTAVGEGWRNELSWTMENTEDLLGYHVYRKTSENGKYSCIASIKDNKYTDSDLTPDKTYYYMVEAVDSRNNTVKSGEVTSVPTNNDDIIPLADAGADTMGIVGEAISFNGSNSWDNHYVASYEWNFGDGMEYLINLGIQGLKRILENRSFTNSERVQQELDDYEEQNNPILGFFRECEDEDFQIENEPTNKAYK